MLLRHRSSAPAFLTSVFSILSLSMSSTTAAAAATSVTCDQDNVCTSSTALDDAIDPKYPGTATQRLHNIHKRLASLTSNTFDDEWELVRLQLLWAGGLKDLQSSRPGQGYTGHSFNDWNHCDLTAMRGQEAHNINAGEVEGIAYSNQLGPGIKLASLEELGPGGSWSTCMMGCDRTPPADVAHLQFKSRIAFKLVWVPPGFTQFVLVDDEGELLASGTPKGELPDYRQRARNWQSVGQSKYSVAALKMAREASNEQ